MTHVWEFTHAATNCLCRSVFDGALLRTEVTAGPDGIDADEPFGWEDYDRAICETLDDLDKAGLLRTALPSTAAAERELRLISDAIREVV